MSSKKAEFTEAQKNRLEAAILDFQKSLDGIAGGSTRALICVQNDETEGMDQTDVLMVSNINNPMDLIQLATNIAVSAKEIMDGGLPKGGKIVHRDTGVSVPFVNVPQGRPN